MSLTSSINEYLAERPDISLDRLCVEMADFVRAFVAVDPITFMFNQFRSHSTPPADE